MSAESLQADPPSGAEIAAPSARHDDGETTQISLRLPERWMTKLRRRAANASTTEDRMVSPQEVVRRILRRELEQSE